MDKKISSALISVFYKDGLDKIVRKLDEQGVVIYSTGGTYDFIKDLGIEAVSVESVTGYPSILGGRVKTLHPKIFGGILSRRDMYSDGEQLQEYEIPEIDLVIVDLYPFEKTVASNAPEEDIIEKIDIGGISLIRAAAKNFKDVVIVPGIDYYEEFYSLLNENDGLFSLADKRRFATYAFDTSSHYDTAIFNYFNKDKEVPSFKCSFSKGKTLRYGENPHQKGYFYGDLDQAFEQLNGKEISYNNLLDIDAAVALINDFSETTVAIIKHNNACGLASRSKLIDAWKDALAGDPVSAFGGVIITNKTIDKESAEAINELFFEILIAPDFDADALNILKSKKNRIVLKRKDIKLPENGFKSALNGVLVQEKDMVLENSNEYTSVTSTKLTEDLKKDLAFANTLVKHTKSNAIVLAKNGQLIASGTGQTSRVDALRQAIEKAKSFGFDLKGAVMASDAFFPFPDCVEIAHEAGITAVIHPGGSIRDNDSVEYAEKHNMAMVITGKRHFKH